MTWKSWLVITFGCLVGSVSTEWWEMFKMSADDSEGLHVPLPIVLGAVVGPPAGFALLFFLLKLCGCKVNQRRPRTYWGPPVYASDYSKARTNVKSGRRATHGSDVRNEVYREPRLFGTRSHSDPSISYSSTPQTPTTGHQPLKDWYTGVQGSPGKEPSAPPPSYYESLGEPSYVNSSPPLAMSTRENHYD